MTEKKTTPEVTPVKAEAPDTTGLAIANALKDVINSSEDKKKIRISVDRGVNHRFSVVKNKATGEFLLRDNTSGVLSNIQLKSVEEKQSHLQKTEVEER